MPLFGAAFAAPKNGTTILYWFKSLSTVLSPTDNLLESSGTFQGIWVIYQYFSRHIQFSMTFQESPLNSSTFQACANLGLERLHACAGPSEPLLLTLSFLWVCHAVFQVIHTIRTSWHLPSPCRASDTRHRDRSWCCVGETISLITCHITCPAIDISCTALLSIYWVR